MKILVTGAAGFIGSSLIMKLLELGEEVCGIDNHNSYYDPQIKLDRIQRFLTNKKYTHNKLDISDSNLIEECFQDFKPDVVVNLAAQAGVRYSIENPNEYVQTNLVGFANILESSKKNNVQHIIYASSSSVYGANTSMPFSIHENTNHPLSLYAATKKSNELMAHTYSHLFQIPTTGLRFFTVYGPWGRPDMALFKFTKSILNGEKINVFNHGQHRRDFTYIDDIVEGIIKVISKPATPNTDWNSSSPDPGTSSSPWRIYNIGNNKPIELMDYIKQLENSLGVSADINYLPLQPGDVPDTYADVKDLIEDFGYNPSTNIKIGITNFVNWYKDYYGV